MLGDLSLFDADRSNHLCRDCGCVVFSVRLKILYLNADNRRQVRAKARSCEPAANIVR